MNWASNWQNWNFDRIQLALRQFDLIDFDKLRQIVDEHCCSAKPTNGVDVSMWSSPTESLLAWNANSSSNQE